MSLVTLRRRRRHQGAADLPSTSFHARRTAGRQRQVTLLSQVPQQRSHAVLLKTSSIWTPAHLDAGILRRHVKWTDASTQGRAAAGGRTCDTCTPLGCINRRKVRKFREKHTIGAPGEGKASDQEPWKCLLFWTPGPSGAAGLTCLSPAGSSCFTFVTQHIVFGK